MAGSEGGELRCGHHLQVENGLQLWIPCEAPDGLHPLEEIGLGGIGITNQNGAGADRQILLMDEGELQCRGDVCRRRHEGLVCFGVVTVRHRLGPHNGAANTEKDRHHQHESPRNMPRSARDGRSCVIRPPRGRVGTVVVQALILVAQSLQADHLIPTAPQFPVGTDAF